MNLLPASDFAELLQDRPGPYVSLYFPTMPAPTRRPQGRTRLRHLLDQAGSELAALDLDDTAVASLLEPLADLLDDTAFWTTREEGTALFRAPGFTRVFHLPRAFPERCVVGDHFFVKPLLPLVAADDRFYVLALSQNEVRLLEATCRQVTRPAVKGLPANLYAALGGEKTPQMLQYHTASRPGGTATYHGQGVGEGDVKDELRRYLRQVEAAVRKLLAGRQAPLVLAGAEPLVSIYRKLSGYAHLAGTVIAGNPERLTDEELRDRAWQILEPAGREVRRRAAERFGELTRTGQASSDAAEILPAAHHGRVATLFLACDADLWGRLGPLERVAIHPAPEAGDEELLNTAALLSLRHGGTVFGMDRDEVPGGKMLAAIYRY
ncbi:MAG TPA: hypothetical protein VL025_01465 [Thermoanaerobaculia bacterium]|nr:hypothetical protein [Thermoanaerobaculia bacterium]